MFSGGITFGFTNHFKKQRKNSFPSAPLKIVDNILIPSMLRLLLYVPLVKKRI